MPDDVIRTDHAFCIFCDNVALPRFMSGQDLYITPRNGVEFYNTLRSYTFDALYNLISQSRRELPVGGYSLACEVASNSILAMLGTDPKLRICYLCTHRRHTRDPGHLRAPRVHLIASRLPRPRAPVRT
ncbi:hypothetical protein M422DRAFT_276584 [Sphaerobolus stellatus SS14]|uniref:Uncharacterized protein n=1 Tax=Sphaerobolus stellatus (strain SS14) TaxID=990650 RepID=A0A0C9U1Q2_SPHS4|nr:hypothetical protein M422DRAFT_276584 [Sphaerobolus stellatus SS14]